MLFPCDNKRNEHLSYTETDTDMAALIFLVIFIVQTIAEKRILLNDPSLLQSQIHALEKKMEDMVAKYTDLSVKYADLFTKNNDQSAKYNDLSAKYNTLLTKTNGMYTFNYSRMLKTKIHTITINLTFR